MIITLTNWYYQYYGHFMTWYHGADILTQYVVILGSAVALFLLSIFMVLTRLLR